MCCVRYFDYINFTMLFRPQAQLASSLVLGWFYACAVWGNKWVSMQQMNVISHRKISKTILRMEHFSNSKSDLYGIISFFVKYLYAQNLIYNDDFLWFRCMHLSSKSRLFWHFSWFVTKIIARNLIYNVDFLVFLCIFLSWSFQRIFLCLIH